ncbi:hypothetical protein GZ77_04700 [Endozoicomonas montiporae]|uniref:Uncharacterized protein n=2 Tax=Endozoicomonas montiporae TaxID=1027273 RepID=A0A081NBK1_9GAMM|nr:hypothetical protein [Endozoicomonas montiporae]AMO56113.1 hypothetical protein EZMO1_1990 [Endozoicomonas montiporae CL-33]KEQ15824.1 hypothetical protein GZ77_04700 [Endozoicomonas montiporae]
MTLDEIELPDDLLWINEFNWNPVEQTTDRSLSGALLVQEQSLLHGRPIELSGNDESGWVPRSTVEALLLLAQTPNKIMTLTLPDERTFTVIFDRRNGSPIQAQQVLPYAYPDDGYQYRLTILFLTVSHQ